METRRQRWLARTLTAILLVSAVSACVSQGLSVEQRGSALWMSGHIRSDDGPRVRDMIRSADGVTRVILGDSPGGEESSAMMIGRAVRARGLDTVVAGQCYSGCAAIFLGGVNRQFAYSEDPYKFHLGFHGGYFSGMVLDLTLLNMRRAYFKQMLGQKYDSRIVDYWLSLEQSSDSIVALPPGRVSYKDAGLYSLLECRGRGPTRSGSGCAPILELDVEQIGIITDARAISLAGGS